MISFETARQIIWKEAQKRNLQTEKIPLEEAPGRMCAQELYAGLNMPLFDNSAMDGFAVLGADLMKADKDTPVTLEKIGTIAAGDPIPDQGLLPGTCVGIMTGAPLPPNADAVIPVENVRIKDDSVSFFASGEGKKYIRCAGADFAKGDALLWPGQRVRPAHVVPLASLGLGEICVYKRLRAAFVSTGSEVIDDLSAPLEPGKIYNSNRPYAISFLKSLGIDCVKTATIRDDPEDFLKILSEWSAENLDFVISSGAVSAGDFDFIKNALEKAGASILYHKIRIKPGKPRLLARLKNGTLYFGVPGNPVSTTVGLRVLVDHAWRAMTGQVPEAAVKVEAVNSFSKGVGVQMFLKGQSENKQKGMPRAKVMEGQESFMVKPFLHMDMWLSMPEDADVLAPGDIVDAYPLVPDGCC